MFLPWIRGLVASSEVHLLLRIRKARVYGIYFLSQLEIFYCNPGLDI